MGVIGLTRGAASVGDACAGWCPKAGCLPTKWWECGAGGSGSGGGGGNAGTLSPGGSGGIPACSFTDQADGQTKVTCPSGASGFVKGAQPADEPSKLAACKKVCEPWRPVEVPRDGRGGGAPPPPPPPPAQYQPGQTPAAKYDPTAGVLV